MAKTARERLIHVLTNESCTCGSSDACPTPEALVDAYAHQLAEQIRAHIAATWPREFTSGETAADLIDPEVQP